MKRITIITGHYGCGKTNLSVNLALNLAFAGKKVVVADLDIVNPYFRTADFSALFAENGIRLVAPQFANTNVDIPVINFDITDASEDEYIIIDVGGDDSGAYALGRFSDSLNTGDYDMLYVINKYRYMTADPNEDILMLRSIEAASRLRHTGIVNNSNLGAETTAETVTDSAKYAGELSGGTGLPLIFTAADETLDLHEFCGKIFPVKVLVKPLWEK